MATSKKRKAARAWMKAERLRAEEQSREAERRAARQRDEEWERKLTRFVPKDRHGDTFYPQGPLKEPYIRIALSDNTPLRYNDYDPYRYSMHARMETVLLTPTQHALVLPDGSKVIWFGWELRA